MNQALSKAHSFIVLALVALLGLASTSCTDCTKPDPDDQDKCEDSVLYFGNGDPDGSSANGGSAAGGSNDGASTTSDGGSGGSSSNSPTATGTDTGTAGSDAIVHEWGQDGHEASIDSGGWDVDSVAGTYEGQTVVHPPALDGGARRTMEFDCGGEPHTQMSFAVRRLTDQTTLELLDGGTSRGFIDVWGWTRIVINVPRGVHTYTLEARNTGTTNIGVPYLVDSFECKDVSPSKDSSTDFVNSVDFDDDFVPLEIDAGTDSEWYVDNLVEVHQGEAAAHPPLLEGGEQRQMTFDCGGAEHTQMSFTVRRFTDQTELELFDGDVSRGLVEVWGWSRVVINVPKAVHIYTLVARNTGTTAISVPYAVDTFVCKDVTPEAESSNAFVNLVDFDDGYIPLEVDLEDNGAWFVDNLVEVHQGEAAAHPPALEGGDAKSITFDCAGMEHRKISFAVRRFTDQTSLELVGPESSSMIDVWGWNTHVIEAPSVGAHTWTLTARNTGTTRIEVPYAVDTFVCE